MNYIVIPLLVIPIIIFQSYLKQNTSPGILRENTCVIWCITLLFSLLGGIISYHIYQYEMVTPLSGGLAFMLLLYLTLTLLFIALSPSGYRRIFHRNSPSPEELLYAEYRFNHSLEQIRNFFLLLLLVIPFLFRGYQFLKDNFSITLLLEEAYLIGGLYFLTFCILFPLSLRQSIYWLRQLQKFPPEYEKELLQEEKQRLHYHKRNHKIY